MTPQHAAVRSNTKIYLSGRTGIILWDDDSKGRYFIIFASDYYLRVKDLTDNQEFVTIREALWRFYPDAEDKA